MKARNLALIVFAVWLISGLVMWAQNVSLYKREGAIPEVVNIKASMPDTARVCIEPPAGGLVVCRSVGEVRKWMLETRAK